jgi:hypothetical protein
MTAEMIPTAATAATVTPQPDLLAELEETVTDAIRRASNRAEHIRLTHIQSLVAQLAAPPAPS